MRQDLYYDLYAKEQDYWWHVGKRAIVYSLLNRYLPSGWRGRTRALDLGCGTGLNLDHLSEYGQAVGTDYYEEALQFCRMRGHLSLCKADAAELPFTDRSFGIVTALDVIEHLDDDVTALREIRRILRPGGVAIISVPAFPWLWTYWDDILGHRRRYTSRMMREAVETAGLKVEKISYSNTLILVPAVGVRVVKTLLHKSAEVRQKPEETREPETDFMPVPPWVNKLLIGYYRMEARLLRRARLPFGLSVVCVARRNRDDR
jgi:SAM-dependent methyltransferase